MNNNTFKIDSCEVCHNEKLISVLNLGMHPMCDDLVPIGDSRVCNEYPIEIIFCKKCLTAHQHYQVPKQDLFPKSYHYRSRFTADVLKGMYALVESTKEQFGDLDGKLILDIGCNDGSLLDYFKEKGAKTIGIEPTGASNEAREKEHIVYDDFLSENVAREIAKTQGIPDFITFTNVFAHIDNLREVFNSLKFLIGAHTIIIIENHYLGSVLKGNQFDTFYHEHPRSYSYTSFKYMAASLGMDILNIEFPSRYGGNIRVFMSNKDTDKLKYNEESIVDRESSFIEIFEIMSSNIEEWRISKKNKILALIKKHGKLRAKAFPGRAAILIKLLDLSENHISAVYEKPGSMKIGNYLPGTRIPICSDEELFASKNDNSPILNLAWHIPKEIEQYMAKHGMRSNLLDIISVDDFMKDVS
jgi:SAM-dependent methyltransferase